jgi:cell wall-associated NlpC family hydrolase
MASITHTQGNEYGGVSKSPDVRDHSLVREANVQSQRASLNEGYGFTEADVDAKGSRELASAADNVLTERRSAALRGESAADDISKALGRGRGHAVKGVAARGSNGRSITKGAVRRGPSTKKVHKFKGTVDGFKPRATEAFRRKRFRKIASGIAAGGGIIASDSDDLGSPDLGDNLSGKVEGATSDFTRRGIRRLRKYAKRRQKAGEFASKAVTADGARAEASPGLRRSNVRRFRNVTKKAKQLEAQGMARAAAAKTAEISTTGFIGKIVAAIVSAVTTAVSAIGAALLPIILIVVAFAVVISIFSSIFGVASEEEVNVGTLTGDQAEIAQFLMGTMHYSEVQTAAVMGNIEAESGYNFGSVEEGNNIGHGILQWSYGRWAQLRSYASSKGKSWTDHQVQLEFLKGELENNGQWITHQCGNWTGGAITGTASKGTFSKETDITKATVEFMCSFVRPNEDPGTNHYARRVAESKRILAALQSGAGIGGGGKAGTMIAWCKTQLGVPYVWAGETPGVGMDCSGFVKCAYRKLGINLPHQSQEMASACIAAGGKIVDQAHAQPGDIVWYRPGGGAGGSGHVAIYLGGGMQIEEVHPVCKINPTWGAPAGYLHFPQVTN